MLHIQTQFYTLLQHHANWWAKAYYFASKRNMVAAEQFRAQQDHFAALAAYIKNLGRAQFARWLYCHQREYVFLFFHLQSLYPGLTA